MRVLFPSQPFAAKEVDPAFEGEWNAARQAGLAVHLLDAEALDAGAYDRAVRRLELQDESLTGGLVFREFVELEPLTVHSKSGMPLTREFRSFFLDGRPLVTVEYWEEGEYRGELPPADLFVDVARRVESRFFTMDVARRTDGRFIIMELGDAQVAGLPERLDPNRFDQALAERTR